MRTTEIKFHAALNLCFCRPGVADEGLVQKRKGPSQLGCASLSDGRTRQEQPTNSKNACSWSQFTQLDRKSSLASRIQSTLPCLG